MARRLVADARDRIVERDAQALTIVTVTLGGVITISSRARWSAPAWHDALRVPHAPATWGTVILAAGLLMLAGNMLEARGRESRRVLRVGYLIAWLWSSSLAAVQFAAFLHDESGTANAIGFVIWCYMAFLYNLRFGGTNRRNYE